MLVASHLPSKAAVYSAHKDCATFGDLYSAFRNLALSAWWLASGVVMTCDFDRCRLPSVMQVTNNHRCAFAMTLDCVAICRLWVKNSHWGSQASVHTCSTQIAKSEAYSGLLKVAVSPSAAESAHVVFTTGTSGAATARQSIARGV